MFASIEENYAVLNDVYVNSLTTAITVGNNGAFYSTTDSGVSWNTNDGIINNSGLGNLILNPSRNLSSINVANDKTFIISSTVVPYSISSNNIPQPAESKIYSCYFPDIFDSINNNVLDVCGNMRLSDLAFKEMGLGVSDNAMTLAKDGKPFLDEYLRLAPNGPYAPMARSVLGSSTSTSTTVTPTTTP